jgi:CDP-glucose 4,6-dehydratase
MGKWSRPLETMVMVMFSDVFRGKRVLLTGHSGFKGSWLALWLKQLGAQVYGISLGAPTAPSHLALIEPCCEDYLLDIRDQVALLEVVKDFQPELVMHLAAQPLVRQSYLHPAETWQTNLAGTMNLLEACRQTFSVKAIVVVTTDKVYLNKEQPTGYTEEDPLGGHDPYSASKAACEILVQSYRQSFFAETGVLIATARAGNVIGGGDWSNDRLIPDIVRASVSGQPLNIRYPDAIRPWQHVLDSLSGYLCLAAKLVVGDSSCARAWNFGPAMDATFSVRQVLRKMQDFWPELSWQPGTEVQPKETELLLIDSRLAQSCLDWSPVWDFEQTALHTALWYQSYYQNRAILSQSQLALYQQCAREQGLPWAIN